MCAKKKFFYANWRELSVDFYIFLPFRTAYFPVACIDHVLLISYYTLSLLFVKIYLSRQ